VKELQLQCYDLGVRAPFKDSLQIASSREYKASGANRGHARTGNLCSRLSCARYFPKVETSKRAAHQVTRLSVTTA
jgi:hypothetical protein